jgi:hypothetical protein
MARTRSKQTLEIGIEFSPLSLSLSLSLSRWTRREKEGTEEKEMDREMLILVDGRKCPQLLGP